VQRPQFADERHRRRLRRQERAEVGILLGPHAGLARGAEGHELRVAQREGTRAPEELRVLGIGARPAALDVVHAEAVEQPRDLQLVVDREAEPLALRAVAQRRIEEVDLGLHLLPPKTKRPPASLPEAIYGAPLFSSGRAGAPGG